MNNVLKGEKLLAIKAKHWKHGKSESSYVIKDKPEINYSTETNYRIWETMKIFAIRLPTRTYKGSLI